jgi:DHA1 family bicyclomycin/chloramphenicol resistance-like MFS transporter
MSRASLRTVLPLALVTGTSMLATDLYLPAVPVLQKSLGIEVTAAQATVAIFFAGLALSQLAWGESLNRLGPRRCIAIGVVGLILTSVACALAESLPWLLAFRFLQGLAAGAATIVAPSVVRSTLDGADAVRGIAAISMVEALVPAAGPVLGAALLVYLSWRGTFWILALAALIVLPIVLRITPRELPGLDHSTPAGYGRVLANRRFLRIILSHALMGGALFMFVASAPQLLHNAYGLGAGAFATLQVIGVAGFIITASRSSRIAGRLGNGRAVRLGAIAHIAICAALALISLAGYASYPVLLVFWCCFCCILAVRGPPAISDALHLPAAQMGRASAVMILALLIAAALGTQLIAPLLDGPGVLPMAVGMLLLTGGSIALITPYPAPQTSGNT